MLTLQSLPSNAYPLEPIPALLVVASPVLVPPPFLDDPQFGLSLCKEGGVTVQVSHPRDGSPPLVKVVFYIQMAEDEMMMQPTDLFRVTF